MIGNLCASLSRPRLLLHAALILIALSPALAGAQLSDGPVSDEGGPLSDRSTNVGAGSAPVHEPGRSVSEATDGSLSGNPVRGSTTGNVTSGPVSDVSSGPVTEHAPVSGGGAVESASVGSVKKDVASPLLEMTAEPVSDLGPLQQQLRAIEPLPRNPLPSDETATEQPTAEQPAAPEATPGEAEAEAASEPVQVAEPEGTPVELPEGRVPTPMPQPPENEPPAEDGAEPVGEQPPEPAAPEPEAAAESAETTAEEKADQAPEPEADATPPQPEAAPEP